MLQLKNITKNYYVGTQVIEALRGITVNFRKSEFVSVLGQSGCGKTTLMNVIGGLDRYTSGDINVDGISTKNFKDGDWDNYRNKKIGFVFQSYNLIPHISVQMNVELALTLSGISPAERRKRAVEALEKVGLGDQLSKRPNQLSGGQMQRVAIARALINNPEIILLDEPTGALDTKTSEQIMNLIRSIAHDRLVIMVTHNPAIAEKYSTRIIKMLDGQITDDSNPYEVNAAEVVREKRGRTSMSFLTALTLSFNNLMTKKGRTILTAFAGSIGILGIALVLALSNGLNIYIAKMQTDTISSYPITITETGTDISQAMGSFRNTSYPEYPLIEKIIARQDITNLTYKNDITQEYVDYLKENITDDLAYDMVFNIGMGLNIFNIKKGDTDYSPIIGNSADSSDTKYISAGSSSSWQRLMKDDLILSQYDILAGHMPETKNQIVLIVDSRNTLSSNLLVNLGLKKAGSDETEFSFADALNLKLKIAANDVLYTRGSGSTVFTNNSTYMKTDASFSDTLNVLDLDVVGILRINQQTSVGNLSSGVGYSSELLDWLYERNSQSEIVKFMAAEAFSERYTNPFTGNPYTGTANYTKETAFNNTMRTLGGNSLPNSISIYARNFDTKTSIKSILDTYNDALGDDYIRYTDMAELVSGVMANFIDIISYVLIGFTSISLLVSCIMIGIITYISVMERIKEIGILRSIGARKRDIRNVFNAETIIIGCLAGIVGVGIALLLTIPINAVVASLAGVTGIAQVAPLHALILIAISTVLTLISGLIPSSKAAKKDPVLALRTD